MESVAVCLAGLHRGLVTDDRGHSLRKHLVVPLLATLLLALTYRTEDGCGACSSSNLLP